MLVGKIGLRGADAVTLAHLEPRQDQENVSLIQNQSMEGLTIALEALLILETAYQILHQVISY